MQPTEPPSSSLDPEDARDGGAREQGGHDEPAEPAPGWYPDGSGAQRWWDGRAWGAARPPLSPSAASLLTFLCPISAFVGGSIVVPLLVLYLAGDRDTEVREHAKQTLNFQLLVVLSTVVIAVAWVVGWSRFVFTVDKPGTDYPVVVFPWPMLLIFGATGLWAAYVFVVTIAHAICAVHGRRFRYPLTPQFVK